MDAHLGYREILVQARAGDVMAWGGGAAGQAQSIRYQAPGAHTRRVTAIYTMTIACLTFQRQGLCPRSLGVSSARSMQKIAGSRSVFNFFARAQNRLNVDTRVRTGMYWSRRPGSVVMRTTKPCIETSE